MKRSYRFIVLCILCLILFILPSCKVRDANALREGNNSNNIGSNSINLFPASFYENNRLKWGYINEKGDFVIKPSFDRAEDFQENGLAFVHDGDNIGIIDRNGNYITQERFSYTWPYTGGITVGLNKSGYKAIDEKGQIIFESDDFIGNISEGMASFSQRSIGGGSLHGYIDQSGKIVIEPKYKYAEGFSDGKAVVKVDDYNYEIIDKTGKPLSTFNYYYVGQMGEGLIAYRENDMDKIGFMDESGKSIIPPSFDYTSKFKNGLAIAVIYTKNFFGNKNVLINKKGEYVLGPDYTDIMDLGEGMFAAGKPVNSEWPEMGCKYAIANSNGELLTDFVYYGVSNYKNGLASVNDGKSTFFIDKEGKKTGKTGSFDGIGELTAFGDVIKINIDNRISYMNKKGNLIWKSSDEYKITPEISVKENKFRPNRNLLIYYPEILGLKDKNTQDDLNRSIKKNFISEEYNNIRPDEELNSNLECDFKVPFYNKDLLIIEMEGYEYPFGAAHGMPVRSYSHIDLKTGKVYELKDLFRSGSSYLERINKIIRMKIDSNPEDYSTYDFEKINDEKNFIITEDSLHIYFTPYEIASYADGFPEFEIPFEEIMDLINTDGEFWKAFN